MSGIWQASNVNKNTAEIKTSTIESERDDGNFDFADDTGEVLWWEVMPMLLYENDTCDNVNRWIVKRWYDHPVNTCTKHKICSYSRKLSTLSESREIILRSKKSLIDQKCNYKHIVMM